MNLQGRAVKNRRSRRRGLRIRGNRCSAEVRGAIIRFAVWLRREYEFPIRVTVHMSPHPLIRTITGTKGSASFFAPWDHSIEPFIRLATGDYRQLRREMGRDNALASVLCSLCHELIHYQQWVRNDTLTEDGVAWKARKVLRRYEGSTAHP